MLFINIKTIYAVLVESAKYFCNLKEYEHENILSLLYEF